MTASDVGATVVVLFAFIVVRRLVYRGAALGEQSYHSAFILPELLRAPEGLMLFVLAAIGGWRLRRHRVVPIPGVDAIRVVVLAAAFSLVLAFSIYDYNAWFGQWHAADRVLLVVLGVATVRTLLTLPAFVVLAVTTVSQFHYPIGLYSWTDKRLIVDLLIIACVSLAVLPALASTIRATWMVWMVVLGSWYLDAGLGKLWLGWLGRDRLEHLFVSATTSYGWLDLDAQQVSSVASVIESTGLWLQIGVLVLECSVVLLLAGRRTAMLVSAGLIALHAGIFAASGIFFWKWIILHVALIAVLRYNLDDRVLMPVYRSWLALMAPLAMLGGTLWGVTQLAWFDSPLSTSYELHAVGCEGSVARLGPEDFGPYRIVFAQGRFGFLTTAPLLVDTFGTVEDLDRFRSLDAAESPSEVLAVIEHQGQVEHDEAKGQAFYALVSTFATQGFEESVSVVGRVSPPHIWGSRGGDTESLAGVRRIEVSLVSRVRAEEGSEEIRRIALPSIDVLHSC